MKAGRFKQWVLGIATMALPVLAFAQSADPKRWQLNMGQGVTPQSLNAYSAHMQVLWICVIIGILVFGAMAVAMFKFRHSKGAVPDRDFTHSTRLEIVWTVIPVERRKEYMNALEQASSFAYIGPLEAFVANLAKAQAKEPLPRPH